MAEASGAASGASGGSVYVLEVSLESGPMTERFIQENEAVSRTIEIRGDQTLGDLHRAIFAAFDREEEHLYLYEVGEGPEDPDLRTYVHPVLLEEDDYASDPNCGDATKTTVASLGLVIGQGSGYLFDPGDEWWHQVDLLRIEAPQPGVTYPRITERVGPSPPQYADIDELGEWDEDEDGMDWEDEDE